ncbi:MAG TPA: DUF488 family protein [Chloroflexia bacterium]|nr:DUF488 family protein [Chloroflexia bacterium]
MAAGNDTDGHPEDTVPTQQPLRFGHACATRPSEWPPDAHLVLAMRRPRWRTRPVLEAGGRSVPAAGPSDALLNAYLGKPPRGAHNTLGLTPEMPKLTWEEFAEGYRQEMRTPEGLRVLDELIDIAQQDPARPLIVLCWERLDGPSAHAHCHRTVLVELLEERARERGLATI